VSGEGRGGGEVVAAEDREAWRERKERGQRCGGRWLVVEVQTHIALSELSIESSLEHRHFSSV
jgi:hypothetical protein